MKNSRVERKNPKQTNIIALGLIAHSFFMDDCLVVYCFAFSARLFQSCRDASFAGEGLQDLGLSSAPTASELGGIFIV